MTHVWMKHAEHGGAAAFPEESVPAWTLKGWEPCDPPADVDPAMAEHQPRFAPSVGDLLAEQAEMIAACLVQADTTDDEPSTENIEEH